MEDDLRKVTKYKKPWFQALSDMIFIFDSSGKYLEYIGSQDSPLVLPKENLIGKNLSEILPKDVSQKFILGFSKSSSSNRTQTFNYKLQINDNYKQFECRISKISSDRFMCIVKDITEIENIKIKLLVSQKKFKSLIEQAGDGITITNNDGMIIDVNTSFCNMIKYLKEDILKKNIKHFLHKSEEKDMQEFFRELYNNKDKRMIKEWKISTKDNKLLFVEVNSKFTEDGAVISIIRDITERKKAERRLKASEERWHFALESGGEGVWDWNRVTHEEFYSERWKKIMEIDDNEESIRYSKWIRRVHKDDIDKVKSAIREYVDVGFTKVEYRVLDSNGDYKWILSKGKVIKWTEDNKPARIIGTSVDITDRKSVEEKIRYLSFHDSLTGLYNRSFFQEELERLDKKGELPLSIIMGDVDGLKEVNDKLGHLEGDNLLKNIAGIIKGVCHKKCIITRWGGDEFGIILPKTSAYIAFSVCEEIRNLCENCGENKYKFSISLGASTKYFYKEDINEVLKRADFYMYKDKAGKSKTIGKDDRTYEFS